MDAKKELIIFRIVQEAFNNIIRHAKAANATVVLHYDAQGLCIKVTDDGVGFDVPGESKSSQKNKAGLKNMETRTKMIGGEMKIESSSGTGTVLLFTIPF